MTQHRHTIKPARAATLIGAALVAASLTVTMALAQVKPPEADTDQVEPPGVEGVTPPVAEEAQPAPDRKRSRPRGPRTAAEKARLLSDLYAQLATAETENDAKRLTGTIERLWAHSGSDTVALLMGRANKAMGEKNSTLALKMLDFVTRLAPDYAEGFNRRAFIHFTLNDYQAAVGDLRRTLALEPNHYKAMEGLAQIWRQTGNKRGALSVVRQLLEVHPFASGAKQMLEELTREVDGQGI